MNQIEDFKELNNPPVDISATSVMIRLIDGIQFRFYWATEQIREIDHDYRPADDCMSINELLFHIEKLCFWIKNSFTEEPVKLDFPQKSFMNMRLSILETLKELKNTLISFEDVDLNHIKIRDFPFWNMINGPLADILTHVGQINTYRRLNGNPVPKISPFTGK